MLKSVWPLIKDVWPIGLLRLIRRNFIKKRNLSRANKQTVKLLKNDDGVLKTLARSVRYVYDMAVEGDIAEFGTMSGTTAVILATAANHYNSVCVNDVRGTKRVFYFDSFEGLPKARFDIDKNSHHVSTGLWGEGTCFGLDEFAFKKVVSKYLSQESFSVYKGFFKDTVPTIDKGQKFGLIHIDSDLYESAIDVLDSLFGNSQVSEGAVILFDDWNCNAASPLLGERKAFSEVCEKYDISFSDAGSYGVASHRFIIHSYRSST